MEMNSDSHNHSEDGATSDRDSGSESDSSATSNPLFDALAAAGNRNKGDFHDLGEEDRMEERQLVEDYERAVRVEEQEGGEGGEEKRRKKNQ